MKEKVSQTDKKICSFLLFVTYKKKNYTRSRKNLYVRRNICSSFFIAWKICFIIHFGLLGSQMRENVLVM